MPSFRKQIKVLRRKFTYSDFALNCIANTAVFLLAPYVKTLKVTHDMHAETKAMDKSKALYGFWHGKQSLLVPFFGALNVTIMTDISWAGKIQARILRRLGYNILEGSSRHQSFRVLLQMKKSIEQGHPSAFALDGPKGPIHESKPGIIFLSRKLSLPIVPIACSSSNNWVLSNTWCRYTIPKPFSRCIISVGKPITINNDFASTDLDVIVNDLQRHNDQKIEEK